MKSIIVMVLISSANLVYYLILSTANVINIHIDMEDDGEEKNLYMYIQVYIVHLHVYFWHPKNMSKKEIYIFLKLKY